VSLPLPIDAVLPELARVLTEHGTSVLRAATGAGKTTRVPVALWERGISGRQQILVLQPRRVAARAVARRMADELRTELGELVGYQVRFDRKTSDRTRILVVTEGILIRRLLEDPFLEDIGCVILDEFHERHLDSDLALAMVRRVQQTVRPDLKLLVMSATLDPEPLVRALNQAPFVDCPTPRFPIDIRYLPHADSRPLAVQAAAAVLSALEHALGDILVFLPGVGEIWQTVRQLERQLTSQHSAIVLPLFGDLTPAEQDRVFEPTSQRKIIVSTNVAETSLTIPGVTAVVDSGWARVLEFDTRLGLNELVMRPISQASADQRAGRAGRLGPGSCWRLWTEASHRARKTHDTPEIQRVDLSWVLLTLTAWGETNAAEFPWFEPPPPTAWQAAEQLLTHLGVLNRAQQLTPLGQKLSRFPLAPRLATLLVTAQQLGVLDEAAWAAAMLSERSPFAPERSLAGSRAVAETRCTVLDRVLALQRWDRTGDESTPWGAVRTATAAAIRQLARQLMQLAQREQHAAGRSSSLTDSSSLARSSQPSASNPSLPGRQQPVAGPLRSNERALSIEEVSERFRRAMLAAYPDRLCRRRVGQPQRAVMVGQRGVMVPADLALGDDEFFLAIDVDGLSGEESQVRLATVVSVDWLNEDQITETVQVEYDAVADRVQARRKRCWVDFVLKESPAPLPDDETVAAALALAAQDHWPQAFPAADEGLKNLLERFQSIAVWRPDDRWPSPTPAGLHAVLPLVCLGKRRLSQLDASAWRQALLDSLSYEQRRLLDEWAPDRWQAPSGRRCPVLYRGELPPIIAARIQDLFGSRETPRLAGGRIPVVLHLLAPNDRPEQVTADLASFWANVYPTLRKELQRRYPRHAWPEDPLTAIPVSGPIRRRPS
jgi:ATP-dependent helicase HrpB